MSVKYLFSTLAILLATLTFFALDTEVPPFIQTKNQQS